MTPGPDGGVAFQLADVNGDGRDDVAGFQAAGTTLNGSAPAWHGGPTARIFTAVSTGDGTYVTHVQDTGQPWKQTFLTENAGDDEPPGYPVRRGTPGSPDVGTCGWQTNVYSFVMDATGDGRADVVVRSPEPHP